MPLKRKSSRSIVLRPPIVAILGHVDHGKTTLLSAIRETDLTAKEYGGITQHIGAYQVEYKGEKITFIDTPGHAAFAKMRSYGAAVTDLVVLVVAADDGVKPQTKESLSHIKQAKVPFLVAINKIDLPQASVNMVKAQLAENGVLVEGYGGDIVCVEVSAKQKKGLDDLLEMILLITKMGDLKANPNGSLKGVVIDSKLDSKKGPVATLLIKNGTLKIGDQIFAEDVGGKTKSIMDENGKRLTKTELSKPIEVLGFKKVPPVGAKVQEKVGFKKKQKSPPVLQKETAEEEKLTIKIILKADTLATLEAIESSLPQEVKVILSEVGQVTESDVLLAQSTGAKIIAFNIKTPSRVEKLAKAEKVNIVTYNIIYRLLEDIEKKVLKILEPTIDEEILGEAKIIAEFNIKTKHIAGCKITKGLINKINPLHLKREDKIIADAKITSFQKERQEIEEAKAGNEAGIVFSPDIDFKIGDVIISYKKKE